MDERSMDLPVEELHAKRAIAMVSKFLDQLDSMDESLRLNRIRCLLKTLKPLSRSENISEYFSEQIHSLIKSLKEQKRLVAFKPQQQNLEYIGHRSSSRSQDNNNQINSKKQAPSSVTHTEGDEASVDKIQNLLIEQKEMQSKELSMERKTQETIIAELAGMTEILKQTTLKIHHSVQKQNHQLLEIQHFATKNEEELEQQKKKMAERTKSMTRSIWASLWSIVWLISVFVLTLAIMKFVPKPSSTQCPSKY